MRNLIMILLLTELIMNSFVIDSYLIHQQQKTILHKRSAFLGSQPIKYKSNSKNNSNNNIFFIMRDTSISYWFNKHDIVQVCDDVYIKHETVNIRGYIGTVIDTWEKCTIDPTCCCAEQVDINMAVRVQFNNTTSETTTTTSSTFTHYFAESELKKIVSSSSSPTGSMEKVMSSVESTINQSVATPDDNSAIIEQSAESVPQQVVKQQQQQQQQAFDGMSCVAYKLDQLQLDTRQRKIANYDPQQKP